MNIKLKNINLNTEMKDQKRNCHNSLIASNKWVDLLKEKPEYLLSQ